MHLQISAFIHALAESSFAHRAVIWWTVAHRPFLIQLNEVIVGDDHLVLMAAATLNNKPDFITHTSVCTQQTTQAVKWCSAWWWCLYMMSPVWCSLSLCVCVRTDCVLEHSCWLLPPDVLLVYCWQLAIWRIHSFNDCCVCVYVSSWLHCYTATASWSQYIHVWRSWHKNLIDFWDHIFYWEQME